MSMTGAIVNALAIVAGGAVGLLFQRGIPERVSKTVMIGLGLCVLYIGISGAFACQSILIVIVAMTLGAAAGALLNIDGMIHRLGTWVEAHVHRHEGGPSLAEGFVTASLLCCVGAMAVNGSLDAGIRGDNSILLTKSMIDLVFCAMLATTLGAGVMLAGAAVFVVEGALTLLAGAIAPLLSEAMVADLTCAGSLLVAAIGLNQTGATKIKVADYLPALLFVPLIRWLVSLPVWQQIAAWFLAIPFKYRNTPPVAAGCFFAYSGDGQRADAAEARQHAAEQRHERPDDQRRHDRADADALQPLHGREKTRAEGCFSRAVVL